MNQLSNLAFYNSGEQEAAIHRELSPLCMCTYYPDVDNKIGGPALPIDIELPPRRSYGCINGVKSTMWLFRFDTSYTLITDAPVLRRKLDALAVLSDDDIVISTRPQGDKGPLMLKFNNHDSLTLAVIVVRHALYEEHSASEVGKVWQF